MSKTNNKKKMVLGAMAMAVAVPAVVVPAMASTITGDDTFSGSKEGENSTKEFSVEEKKLVPGDRVNFAGKDFEVFEVDTYGHARMMAVDFIDGFAKPSSGYNIQDKLSKDMYTTYISELTDRKMLFEKPKLKYEDVSTTGEVTVKTNINGGALTVITESDWTKYKEFLSLPKGDMTLNTRAFNSFGSDTYGVVKADGTVKGAKFIATSGYTSESGNSKVRPIVTIREQYAYLGEDGKLVERAAGQMGTINIEREDVDDTKISWESVSGAANYQVYRDNALVYTGKDLSYVDDKARAGTTYKYVVKPGSEVVTDFYGKKAIVYSNANTSEVTVTVKNEAEIEKVNITKMIKGEVVKIHGKNWHVVDIDEEGQAMLINKDLAEPELKYGFTSNAGDALNYIKSNVNAYLTDEEKRNWVADTTFAIEDGNTDSGKTGPAAVVSSTQKLGLMTPAQYAEYKSMIGNPLEQTVLSKGGNKRSDLVYAVTTNGTVGTVYVSDMKFKPWLMMKLKPQYSYSYEDGTVEQVKLLPVQNPTLRRAGASVRLAWEKTPEAIGYEIKRTGLKDPVQIAKDDLIYDDTTTVHGFDYTYDITALYEGGLRGESVKLSTEDIEPPIVEPPVEPEVPKPEEPVDPPVDPPVVGGDTELWDPEKGGEFITKMVPEITVVGGKSFKDITLRNFDFGKVETVTTELGDVTFTPDGHGNTVVSSVSGIGTNDTGQKLDVKYKGTHILTLNVKAKPVLNFKVNFK